MSELIVGAWRAGMSVNTQGIVEDLEAKARAGFRLMPQETAVVDLVEFLEGYDDYTEFLDGGTLNDIVVYDSLPEEATAKVKKAK